MLAQSAYTMTNVVLTITSSRLLSCSNSQIFKFKAELNQTKKVNICKLLLGNSYIKSYKIDKKAKHGKVLIKNNTLIYKPVSGYIGEDKFVIKCIDMITSVFTVKLKCYVKIGVNK